MSANQQLRVVSYNMHGQTKELSQFKDMLQGEHILCLQEVDDLSAVKEIFSDYPYVYSTQNKTTKSDVIPSLPLLFILLGSFGFYRKFFVKTKRTHVLILSKLPFASLHDKLIQTDPGGDKWERHAQHVRVKLNASTIVSLFHYHNTYNWGNDNSKSERSGLEKFKEYVITSLDSLPDSACILAGDFNLTQYDGSLDILSPLSCSTNCSVKWVDYVCGSMGIGDKGFYPTEEKKLSDHDAVWAQLDASVNVDDAAGRIVQIFNLRHKEYLYAADYAPFDNDRRRVFTWRPGTPVAQGDWRLEPVGNGEYRIFNTHHKEYLYAADYKPFDKDRRRVFTWRPGEPVSQGNWRIKSP